MTYNVPPRGYIYVIRINELIENHLRDLDAKDWTIVQRHGYEREVRQRALQMIDQAVANYPEDVHLTGYMADLNWYYEYGDKRVPFPYPSPAENARNYLIKNPGVNIRGSFRDGNLPTTRGGRSGGVQDGHGSAHQSSDVVEQVDVTLSDLSTFFLATIKSSIHRQTSSSSRSGPILARQQTSVHNSNGTWELSLAASSQSATSFRILKRSIGDFDTREDKAVVKRERKE
ncbi:uncharacterized protein EAF02_001869 [Botrytis sinoallii]|uniref:uncharacterized protein n=1 Tax=Botrytis sinoallii TaxID=1463999 RepID=UPI001902BC30|nr:uncharacterized protein EAF02_001869 [Botrytis sinoallii]KAF7891544.1 hypothetical protein EAF02_001869 [Botrytis sinoallii]